MQTKEIVTKFGTKAIIKSVLSFNDLESALKIEDVGEKSMKILEIAVISINGISENIITTIKAGPISDYAEISKAVTNIINGGF